MNITIRDFAKSNNVALPRLRSLLKKYGNVKVLFTRKSVNHYDLDKLNAWMQDNRKRFSDKNTYSHLGNGETFYCSHSGGHYVENNKRSTRATSICSACEIKLRTIVKPVESVNRGKVPQNVIDANERRERIFKARELKEINEDATSWMNA
tara:strand:- start:835 stop:1287 length:453 start_codon:yes stop_codon:yes gene_type:complete